MVCLCGMPMHHISIAQSAHSHCEAHTATCKPQVQCCNGLVHPLQLALLPACFIESLTHTAKQTTHLAATNPAPPTQTCRDHPAAALGPDDLLHAPPDLTTTPDPSSTPAAWNFGSFQSSATGPRYYSLATVAVTHCQVPSSARSLLTAPPGTPHHHSARHTSPQHTRCTPPGTLQVRHTPCCRQARQCTCTPGLAPLAGGGTPPAAPPSPPPAAHTWQWAGLLD